MEDSIVKSVRKDLKQRSKAGIEKYNTTLDRKDLSLKEWLNHAYEECLDKALYLKRAIKEIELKEDQVEFKGELKGYPKEVIDRMLIEQELQGNEIDVTVFEENGFDVKERGGFDWFYTENGWVFWHKVLIGKNFDLFFEKYPKK